MKRIKNIAIFVGYTLLVAFVSLRPPGEAVSVGSYDKAAHFLTYGVFAILAYRLHLARRYRIYLYIAVVAYGGLMEVGQSYIPGREMSALDFLANTLGVVFGALLCDKIYASLKETR